MTGGHSGDSSDSGAERSGSSPDQLPEVKKTRTGEHWSEESSKNCSDSGAGEDWSEESIKGDVESEDESDEGIDKKSDEDDEEKESDEGSDETSDKDDEEKETDGEEDEEHTEEYYGVEKSDTDEEADASEDFDFNPSEVFFERDDGNFPWQTYGNNILLQTFGDDLSLKAAAIVSLNGSYLYWTPAFPQVSSKEMDVIWRVIDLTGNSKISIGGQNFLMVRVEPSLMQ